MAGTSSTNQADDAPVTNPYQNLPEHAFWRTAVADNSAFDIRGLWQPKFHLRPKHKIVTAGSCFAQYIGRALAGRGYGWMDAEPGPSTLSPEAKKKFNYGIFSFRTGNIYTATALLQWVTWAFDEDAQPTEVWEKDGRFYDPFRPAIEPGGFASAEEVLASRSVTLKAIRTAVETTNLFVFTMGLTESWYNKDHGYEYAMCPGTLAGHFDPEQHKFRNHGVDRIKKDMRAALSIMLKHNKKLKLLLTISPVPLTATASGKHVLTATVHSKSTLRAVAGALADNNKEIDYFPSYEIITASPYRAMFFEPNMRSVSPHGVSLVMDNFFDDQAAKFGKTPAKKLKTKSKSAPKAAKKSKDDVVCEEEILSAFAR